MSKKVIGAFLALIMVFSVFSLSALAIGEYYWESEADAEKNKQTWGLADGGNGVVQVTLTTTYEVGPISFVIEGVSLENVDIGNGYYGGNASIDFNKTTGLVLIYPNTGAPVKAQKLNNAVVATFTYTGNATPAIKDDPKQNTADGMNGTLIASRCAGEYVNGSDYYVGQTCEILAFGQAPKPTDVKLQIKSGVTGVVIDETKTFGGQYAGALYGFDVKPALMYMTSKYLENSLVASDGSALTITGVPVSATAYAYGTGTTVKVGDKTYVVVIFGDVNCDGKVNAQDTPLLVNNGDKNIAKDSYVRLAANCKAIENNMMLHKIDKQDITDLVAYQGKKSATFQADLAKLHYETPTTFYK